MRIKRKLVRIVILFICAYIMLFQSSGLADIQYDQSLLSEFKRSIICLAQNDSIFREWNKWTIDQYVKAIDSIGLINESEIPLEQRDRWLTPYHALQYTFELLWGPRCVWTLEEQYDYAQFEIECGLSSETIVALPVTGDMTVDEARKIIRNSLNDKTGGVFFDSYIESIHFWNYPDLGKTWVFEYYSENSSTPQYTGYIYLKSGNVHVDIYDSLDLRKIYANKCFENGFMTFRWWPIHEQYEFYELVVSLQHQQRAKYGELPMFACQILENEYVMPTSDMMSTEEAISIATNHVDQSNHGEQLLNSIDCVWISLYRVPGVGNVYCVGFDSEEDSSNVIYVDAYSGDVLN